MATLKELRDERRSKLEALKRANINPYPANIQGVGSERVRTRIVAITSNFTEFENQQVSVVGRITNIRKFGSIAFIVVKDGSGPMQLFLNDHVGQAADASNSEMKFSQLNLLDSGDFIEAVGVVIKTKTGEISIDVEKLRILSKSLRPLPAAHQGFTNKEERLRRRYVDTLVNPDVYQRYLRRSTFWQATREFLIGEGFIEINIPILENTTGGADANPFVTHMDALDQDFYLRISHELPLKRLLVGGYERVFDIGARFRNENYSDEHLPEHIAMEWYWAYADWEMGMKLTERLVRTVADKAWGTRQYTLLNGHKIDLGRDEDRWPRISFVGVIREHYGIDVFDCTLAEVKAELQKHGLEVEKSDNKARGIDKLWKKVRVTLPGPAFLIDVPTFLQPLAKTQPGNPNLTEQFNLILGGTEACKAYSELNDPIDQLKRFLQQQAMRDAGDSEAQMLDIDYIEALEYGMPPACGFGYSERLFWMLEGVTAREGVVFPQLRREIDGVTRGIYESEGVVFAAQAAKRPLGELPVSAAEHGTRKLYLDNYAMRECDAKVIDIEDTGEGNYRLVLDQTCLYPGGGGQDFDLGEITWSTGRLMLSEISKDQQGVVQHDGVLEGDLPRVGGTVRLCVDAVRRTRNSGLHCAGHVLDWAIAKAGKNWKPGRSAHFPGRCYVEYQVDDYDPGQNEVFAQQIEQLLAEAVRKGGPITSERVSSAEAHLHSDYIPQTILDSYQNVHITRYPNGFAVCCGGTHLSDLSQLGTVKVTKIKKKNGNVRVSYDVE